MSATAASQPFHPPAVFRELLGRFDHHVIDVQGRAARIRLRITDGDSWDVMVRGSHAWIEPPFDQVEPDALLRADQATWERVAHDLRGGMDAFRRGRLEVRRNLHLGVGLLAATSGASDPGRLRFESVKTAVGNVSTVQAGTGHPVVAIHGLGGTKASFLPTLAALADTFRVIAIDLPGFGDSDKPIAAAYDSAWFAGTVTSLLDGLGIERAHLVGNSMGGRIAIEVGLAAPHRAERIVLLSPALAWLRDRRWAPFVKALRPELGLLQVAPRPVVERIVRGLIPGADEGWAAAGVDEFLRAYLTPRGRAAFYAAARHIYLDEPHGDGGFWTRLGDLEPDTMFIWGRQDRLVPISFMKHVERALPLASHVELQCGHVPQLEHPYETHAAMREFFAGG